MTVTATRAATPPRTSADPTHVRPGRHRAHPMADRGWRVSAAVRRSLAMLLCGVVAPSR